MIVYRWENKYSGFGPMCHINDDNWQWYDLFYDHEVPNHTNSEFAKFMKEHRRKRLHVFGTTSLDWLFSITRKGAEEILERCDYELTSWKVTESFFLFNDGQVCFERTKAIKL